MTRLVVVYDEGAANPMEVATGLGPLGEVILAMPPSAHNQAIEPLAAECAETLTLSEDPASAAHQLEGVAADGVLTFSERRVRFTAALTEPLGLPGHSPRVAALLTDKLEQRRVRRRAGVDRTRSAHIGTPADWPAALEHVGVPAIAKPLHGEGSRGTHRIDDPDAGADLVATLLAAGADGPARADDGLVLEEWLPGRNTGGVGDFVSVESAVSQGRVTHLAVTGKLPMAPPFREVGQFWPALLTASERAEVLDVASESLAVMGVHTGLTHTELKLTPSGPQVIEVNGRLGGFLNELSRHATGVDLVRIAGQLALGQPVGSPLPDPAGVTFQCYYPAPDLSGEFRSVRGVPQLRRLPGVVGYRRVCQPGARFEAGGGWQALGVLLGEAPDHARMRAILDNAGATLCFTFRTADGELDLDGQRLCAPREASG